MKRKLIYLLLLVAITTSSMAQSGKTTQTRIENKRLFYVHEVVKGQTLYGLGKLYSVPVDTIIKYNPNTENGLSIGQKVNIPFGNQLVEVYTTKSGDSWYSIAKSHGITESALLALNPDKVQTTTLNIGDLITVPYIANETSEIATSISGKKTTPPTNNNKTNHNQNIVVEKSNIIHTVVAGETLYSIARKYDKTINELQAANPGLTENLSIGQKITIPDVKGIYTPKEQSQHQVVENVNRAELQKIRLGEMKNQYVVYMFIPLYLQSSEIETANIKTLDDYNHIKQFSFIQFYEALLLAAEDISNKYPNINIKLKVEDVNNISATKMNQLINNGDLLDADLIIGPFFSKEFSVLCQYAQKHNICLVNPFSMTFDGCGSFVYKATASYKNQAIKFAEYLLSKYATGNIIIVNNQSNNEQNKIADYKIIFNNMLSNFSIREVNMQSSGIAGIKAAIRPDCENFVFSFFEGEITVTNFVQTMYAGKYQNVTFIVPESWLNYDNIETEYFMDFKTHYISSYFVDYSNQNVINFLNKFRQKYSIEPTLKQFAFQGYDITYYFLSSLCEKGTTFQACNTPNDYLLSTKFEFKPLNANTLENSFVNIFKIKDYHFVEATNDIDEEDTKVNKKKR